MSKHEKNLLKSHLASLSISDGLSIITIYIKNRYVYVQYHKMNQNIKTYVKYYVGRLVYLSNYINNQMKKEEIMRIIKRTLKGQKSFCVHYDVSCNAVLSVLMSEAQKCSNRAWNIQNRCTLSVKHLISNFQA